MDTLTTSKTEYDFLLGFYLNLSVFDPFMVTFSFLTPTERQEVMLTISVLQRKLQSIMPKVQDREASGNAAQLVDYGREK
jgi:hypothetical protein